VRPWVPDLTAGELTGGHWGRWSEVHRGPALDHQWRQLEATGAFEAFRIAAGRADGVRVTDFFSDSDVYKWLDAACRFLATRPDPGLRYRVDEVVELVEAARTPDGYVNTWVTALCPGGRFEHLVHEHELYCLGHLMEAAVSHHVATGSRRLLDVAVDVADLLVRELADAGPEQVDGHEEIELALVRLHRHTGDPAHLELARRFVERRGTAPRIGAHFLGQSCRTAGRLVRWSIARARDRRRPSNATTADATTDATTAGGRPALPPGLALRLVREGVSGRWFQLDRPAREQVEPTGHAVRWTYLHTAMAQLAGELGDDSFRRATEAGWDRLVDRHLFVNGGLGALPLVEGFGAPYDLDPDRAYCETCAALGSVQWNRELGLLNGVAAHDDLIEWQLCNAAAVGMSVDGAASAYDNPLRVPPGRARSPWFRVPCCPSNLSRAWAALPTLQFSVTGDELRVHQYFSARARTPGGVVEVTSELPWQGSVTVRWAPEGDEGPRRLAFRVPSWAGAVELTVDGDRCVPEVPDRPAERVTASGYDPRTAVWARVDVPPRPVELRLRFELPVRALRQHPAVPGVGGLAAVARGPLLYCLDGADHPAMGFDELCDLAVDPDSLTERLDPDLLGGAVVLDARESGGRPVRLVPYFLWGNRGAHGMTPFVRLGQRGG
jgi:DUF1680 family protein